MRLVRRRAPQPFRRDHADLEGLTMSRGVDCRFIDAVDAFDPLEREAIYFTHVRA